MIGQPTVQADNWMHPVASFPRNRSHGTAPCGAATVAPALLEEHAGQPIGARSMTAVDLWPNAALQGVVRVAVHASLERNLANLG